MAFLWLLLALLALGEAGNGRYWRQLLKGVEECGKDTSCAKASVEKFDKETKARYGALLVEQGIRNVELRGEGLDKCAKKSKGAESCFRKVQETATRRHKTLLLRRANLEYSRVKSLCKQLKDPKLVKKCEKDAKQENALEERLVRGRARAEIERLQRSSLMADVALERTFIALARTALQCSDTFCWNSVRSKCPQSRGKRCLSYIAAMPIISADSKNAANPFRLEIRKNVMACPTGTKGSKCRRSVISNFRRDTEDRIRDVCRMRRRQIREEALKKISKCKIDTSCVFTAASKAAKSMVYESEVIIDMNSRRANRMCKKAKRSKKAKKCEKSVKRQKEKMVGKLLRKFLDNSYVIANINKAKNYGKESKDKSRAKKGGYSKKLKDKPTSKNGHKAKESKKARSSVRAPKVSVYAKVDVYLPAEESITTDFGLLEDAPANLIDFARSDSTVVGGSRAELATAKQRIARCNGESVCIRAYSTLMQHLQDRLDGELESDLGGY
jgi:hypothetical protein